MPFYTGYLIIHAKTVTLTPSLITAEMAMRRGKRVIQIDVPAGGMPIIPTPLRLPDYAPPTDD